MIKSHSLSLESEYTVEIDGFQFVKAQRFIKEKYDIYCREATKEESLEEYFSGEITYKAKYTLPEEPPKDVFYKIHLGDTSVTASVWLQGERVAVLGVTPKEAFIPSEKLKKNGEIKIIIANTAANEKVHRYNLESNGEYDYYKAMVECDYETMALSFELDYPHLKLGKVTLEKIKCKIK